MIIDQLVRADGRSERVRRKTLDPIALTLIQIAAEPLHPETHALDHIPGRSAARQERGLAAPTSVTPARSRPP
jgi:hypothetical protein